MYGSVPAGTVDVNANRALLADAAVAPGASAKLDNVLYVGPQEQDQRREPDWEQIKCKFGVVEDNRILAEGIGLLLVATLCGVTMAGALASVGASIDDAREIFEREYLVAQIARFSGNARLRLLKDGQMQQELSGSQIVFDTIKEEVLADGKPKKVALQLGITDSRFTPVLVREPSAATDTSRPAFW